jgi:hypothetical protein
MTDEIIEEDPYPPPLRALAYQWRPILDAAFPQHTFSQIRQVYEGNPDNITILIELIPTSSL